MSLFVESAYKKPSEYVHTAHQRRLVIREKEAGLLPLDQLTSPQARQEQYDRLERLIGNTPLLGLRAPNGSFVLVKVESQNGLSETHYDRVYVKTLRELEGRGIIKPGDDLFEVTSGSAGIAFAAACKYLGFRAHIFVPKGTPRGRNQEMINLGAILVEAESNNIPDTSRIEQRQFIRMARSRELVPQIYNPDNKMFQLWTAPGTDGEPAMHMINHSENHFTHHSMEAIGEEIASVLPEGLQVDYFVSVLGNGANTRGIADGLRKNSIFSFQTIGVESESNPVQFESKYPSRFEEIYRHPPTFGRQVLIGSSQRGTKVSFIDLDKIDQIRLVSDEEWQEQMLVANSGRKTDVETIGRSSAAELVIAKQLDQEYPGSVILIIFYDKGGQYDELAYGARGISSITFANAPTVENEQMQPLGWKQRKVNAFNDLPATLWTAYKPHLIDVFSYRDPFYRNLDLTQP